MLIVTTPQEVALLDSRKSINFAKSLNLPVLGVVENMRGYTIRGKALDNDDNLLPNTKIEIDAPSGKTLLSNTDENGNWSTTLDIFKSGGGENTAKELGVPFLGHLPFDPGIVRGGDDGVHRIIAEPDGETAKAFSRIVDSLGEQLELEKGPSVNII